MPDGDSGPGAEGKRVVGEDLGENLDGEGHGKGGMQNKEKALRLALGTGALELPFQHPGSSCEFTICSRFCWVSCFP